MRKIVLLFAILALQAAPAFAQDAASVALPFGTVPRNIRTLSRGGATLSDDAAFRVLGDRRFDASLSWYSWSPGTSPSNDINADIFAKFGKFGISAQFAMDMGKAYKTYSGLGVSNGSYTPQDMFLKIGAAFSFSPSFSVGADFRLMRSSAAPKTSFSSVAADITASYRTGGLTIATGVTSLGAGVKSADGNTYPIPSAASLAADYSFRPSDAFSLGFDAQADFYFKGGLRAGAGLECGIRDLFFVRAGYSYAGKSPAPGYLSLGAGFKFAGFRIDAVYLLASKALSGTLGVGLGYTF